MGDRQERHGPSQTEQDLWEESRLSFQQRIRPETIRTLSEAQLLAIEIAPGVTGSALTGPLIEMPATWMPAGTLQNACHRTLDIRKALPAGMDAEGELAKAILLSLRRLLLAFWLIPSAGTSRGGRLPKPSTWVNWSQRLVRMVNWALTQHPSPDGRIFSHLSENDLKRMIAAFPGRGTQAVTTRLTQYRNQGVWHDWPDIDAMVQRENGKARERSRKGEARPESSIKTSRRWQPLSDEFVTEAGWRSIWLIEQFGPALLDCFEACLSVTTGSETTVTKRRREQIANWDWRTPKGDKIDTLPFAVQLEGICLEKWPPRFFDQLRQAVYLVQSTNLFVVSLSMAGRVSDVLSCRDRQLQITAGDDRGVEVLEGAGFDLVEKPDGDGVPRIQGRTFKLVEKVGGAERDWPLPPIAVKALLLQKRLAGILRPTGSDSLWVHTSTTRQGTLGEPLNDPNPVLKAFVRMLGLQESLGKGEIFHHHRCRKTVARLAGLALAGAPKILMDLFGHKTIEMTLSYILSDPDFAAEVQEVAKAQIIIMGKEAVESADENGGAAASGLRAGVAREKARLGEDQFQVEGVAQMAEILTLNGKSCQLVRPGVICTKSPGEMGPCAKGTARIDPSRCKSDCGHRLELAALRDDVDRSIAESVRYLQQAMADSDDCMIEFWRGQLQHHLSRFPDIRDKWMDQPTMAGLLASVMENAA